tara:strand:+ start:326 stop:472 length:147 start_codon:yes stop_codon:yes gene_type:complete
MELTNLEENVLRVALDHLREHLNDIRDEVDVEEKLTALSSLEGKINNK